MEALADCDTVIYILECLVILKLQVYTEYRYSSSPGDISGNH